MANWSKNKTLPENINNGNEYAVGDNVSLENLNAITNNSFYAMEKVANLSNPNLLINGDFRVNQRGQTNYTGNNKYTADRWQQGSGSFNYSTKTWTPTTQYSGFIQKVEDFEKFRGKIITLSIYINSCSTSGVFDLLINDGSNHRTLEPITSGFNGIRTFTYTVSQSATQLRIGLIYLGTSTNDNISIDWVKAEIGNIATPFSPRPYAEELAMCQRYYVKFTTESNGAPIGNTFAYSATNVNCPLSLSLRTSPTIVEYSGISYRGGTSGNLDPTNITVETFTSNNLSIKLTVSGATANENGLVRMNNNTSYLSFDAEIY